MKNITLILSLIAIIFTSCAKTIDATNQKTLEASVEEIKNSLDEAKQKEFVEAIQYIMLDGIDLGKLLSGDDKDQDSLMGKELLPLFDGKTANDVIAEGKIIKIKVEKKKKERKAKEKEELENKEVDQQASEN